MNKIINLIINSHTNILGFFNWTLVTGLVTNQFFLFLLGILLTFSVLFISAKILLNTYSFLLRIRQHYSLLEVRPLKVTEQNPYTTQELFSLVHSLARHGSFWKRFFGFDKVFSFEIVSTKTGGIRYLIRVDQSDSETLKSSLLSYLPGLLIEEVGDYIKSNSDFSRVTNFKLSNHFAFPLKSQEKLDKHDPIAYLTGSMTRLKENELIAFQLLLSPLKKTTVSDIHRIFKLIRAKQDLYYSIRKNSSDYPLLVIVRGLISLMLLPIGFLIFLITEGREGPFIGFISRNKSTSSHDPYQDELVDQVKHKLEQKLFVTTVNLLITGKSKNEINKRLKNFSSALSSFSNVDYQSLRQAFTWNISFYQETKRYCFINRLMNPLTKSILSVSEVSDIYHLPFTKTTKTEDLVKSHSRELPAPISVKNNHNFDVTFARNTYGGQKTKIGLTEEERRRHVYILGATGTGKTTMLYSMIKQDINNRKGLCVIDPHGDLIDQILNTIPKDRIRDVVFFNPDDIGYPIGINLLELTPDLNDDDSLREKEFLAESIISLFHKIYTDKYSGPRMEYILRNTIHTAFTIPDATLFTVYKLLVNTPYRKSVVKNLNDENLKDFWKYEFGKAGNYQIVKMISPITNKIGRFLFSPTAKRILEQPKSTIDFDQIINDGKILLCNVAKGKIGEDTSEVMGIVIMTKLQLAALKRARVSMNQRRDFYLYVDEFQNFATPAFSQILSEARKYRLNATLAHQTTSQLENQSLVNITLANTGTVICFRTANPEDERLILPQFRPYIERGEIASLPSFKFYMKISAIHPEEPFSGETLLTQVNPNYQKVKKVIASSRNLYTKKYVQIVDSAPASHTKTRNQSTTVTPTSKLAILP